MPDLQTRVMGPTMVMEAGHVYEWQGEHHGTFVGLDANNGDWYFTDETGERFCVDSEQLGGWVEHCAPGTWSEHDCGACR